MAGKYAAGTDVSVDRTRLDLERVLGRYGARGFGYATEGALAMVTFTVVNDEGTTLRIQMRVPLPDPNDPEFTQTPSGKPRENQQTIQNAWEQACRQRWRAVLLVVKAKLEAVETGISTIEREFMPDLVMGDGKTLEAHLGEDFGRHLERGGSLPMLPKL